MESLKITLKNLYIENKCRFCGVNPGGKHGNFYHGIADLLGYGMLDIEYEADQK